MATELYSGVFRLPKQTYENVLGSLVTHLGGYRAFEAEKVYKAIIILVLFLNLVAYVRDMLF